MSKYGAPETEPVLVSPWPEQQHAYVLAVSDRGPGIPAAQRERVFERFARDGRNPGAGGKGHATTLG